jgi:hypothetical protein
MIISRPILHRMGNVSDKSRRENKKKNIYICSVTFYPKIETIWKNIVEPGRPEITTQYGAYAINAGNLRLQTNTQNM